jgi:hypothetical protein
MRPLRVIKTFSDLRDAIAAVAAETPAVPDPPMTPDQVKRSAQTFATNHRREAAKVAVLRPKNAAGVHERVNK